MKKFHPFKLILPLAACLAALDLGFAHAATAQYVSAVDVYARSQPQSYAMGRLYTNERMDIQYIDSNGWAYGYAYGNVNRCVWAQFYNKDSQKNNFWTHGTSVSDKCRTTNMYLYQQEFTNGEIWGNNDGEFHFLSHDTYMWDNWVWGGAWGNHHYRGVAKQGSLWKIRYTTYDGAGVMARPCNWTGDWKTVTCASDWIFIQRGTL